ncbi:hypothetical protein BS333_08180 [Vibrio azureus]|nr:hypothetical protein BS333_08180 [Vibrio azureus]
MFDNPLNKKFLCLLTVEKPSSRIRRYNSSPRANVKEYFQSVQRKFFILRNIQGSVMHPVWWTGHLGSMRL